MSPQTVALVSAGGALGTLLRWGIAAGLNPAKPDQFPWGTLAVNLLGCFVIGLLAGAYGGVWDAKPQWKAAVFVGLLGGFTTFSSFALEAVSMIRAGGQVAAALYVTGSVAGGMGLACAGVWTSRWMS